MTKTIQSIDFGILSSDEIKRGSVCKVTKSRSEGTGTVNDDRMGTDVTKGTCVTCGQTVENCTGHFGHIELNCDIIHPSYYKQVLQVLKCTCTHCSRFLLEEESIVLNNFDELHFSERFKAILGKCESVDTCFHCVNPHPKITYSSKENTFTKSTKDSDKNVHVTQMTVPDIKRILSNLPDKDVELMGLNPYLSHPKNMIIDCIPVLPPCARPFIIADGQKCDDDLTIQYIEIIKANNTIGDQNCSENDKIKALQTLKFRISTLFDNSKGKATQNNGSKPIRGMRERISGKGGIIRSNCLAKRVNQSSRTVIGAEPTLKMNELGIPPEVADRLTFPEKVTKYNIDYLTELVNNNGANSVINNSGKKINLEYALFMKGTELCYGDIIQRGERKIKVDNRKVYNLEEGDVLIRNGKVMEDVQYMKRKVYKLELGNTVNRKLKDGDYVLFNRQPTLHRGSMMGMKARILPGKTFRINLSVCASFNADFNIGVKQGA